MATKFFGGVKSGSASVSIDFTLLKTADNTNDTGKVASGLSAYYYRQGASATAAITLSDLANLNSSYSSGGVKEIADGSYRLDVPDAAFSAGADWVEITVKDGSAAQYKERIALEAHGADDVFGLIGAAGAGLTSLGDTRLANLDAAVSTRMATFALPANFAALGITAAGKVSEVVLCDTLTTYTGNTPQTGDAFTRLGAPTGVSIAADIQTRSTFAGGAVASVTGNVGGNVAGSVASVTAPVTAGTVSDKTGYALAVAPPTAVQVRQEVDTNSTQLASLVTSLLAYTKLFTAGTVSDTAPTTTTFKGSSGLSAVSGFYVGRSVYFVANGLLGAEPFQVTGYDGTTKAFTTTTPLPAAPANGDSFWVI